MNFENEPLENEEERELQGETDAAAEFDREDSASEDIAVPADADMDPPTAEAAIDDDSDSALIEQATPDAGESPSEFSLTPATEAVYVDASNGELAGAENAEGGFIELEPREVPTAEAPSRPDESRRSESSASDLSPHAQGMLNPTSDGGPPLARPIIIVRLADDQMEYLVNEICKRMAKRNEQTCRELVQHLINQEFWRRDCRERAIIGQHRR